MISSSLQPVDLKSLSVLQRVLMITDGTVTKILEAYTLEKIRVVKLSEDVVIGVEANSHLAIDPTIPTSILQRKILLQTSLSGVNQIYAESHIVLDRLKKEVYDALLYGNKPIGEILLEENIETYRSIVHIGKEKTSMLDTYFNISKDAYMISRSYIVVSKGSPIMLITEKFPESHFLGA